MKELARKIIRTLVKNEFTWGVIQKVLVVPGGFATNEKEKYNNRVELEKIDNLLSEPVVLNGPFSGMIYPHKKACGSTLFPKLLGSYEKELEGIINEICNTEYTEIVDVGCAEGYYAVGLAMRLPNVKVFAFDINEVALSLCKQMGEINGVADRLMLGTFCDTTTLLNLPLTEKALIICDCEGYEKTLFTMEVAEFLKNHDVLIEVHDLFDLDISQRLRDVFENTHDIQVITSIDDVKKVSKYNYSEISNLTLKGKYLALAESRSAEMDWMFITPKNL